MELLVFGHAGPPVIVFPTSMGRFFEYEDRGMVHAVSHQLDSGNLQLFCVDGVDLESWYNKHVHPYDRVQRHIQYEEYLLHEVIPLIRSRNGSSRLATTGCSFGGYHCTNFALRHPDIVTDCISMSGAYDIHQFLDEYYDQNCYFNCPVDFLRGMTDSWYLDRYRQMRIVLGAGDWDICLGENQRLSKILNDKSVPHWLDVWGEHIKHDWPLWQRMAVKFF
jgi:esterase/lipase superfamily enzyme